ncbi:IS91 family transposase [bacterium]|nr:IS91 family transposase [bacterium]
MGDSRIHSENQRPAMELADILKRYLPSYLKRHNVSTWQRKILFDIQICRTAACGGHIEACDHCDYRQPAYNSCHNRHCPKCQGIARRRWVSARLKEIFPVPYYHVVFTLPHRLNNLALYNKHLIYHLFYRAASYTLLKFGKDPRYVGGQIGFIGVLHTWGKGMCHHIHWHFIVPGCGLTDDGDLIVSPNRDKFLFPVIAMSKVVRGRFIKLLKKSYYQQELTIPDCEQALTSPVMFEYFLNDLASDEWVCYAKRPFGGPEQVVKYIGRYTHRVALSNKRLINIDGGRIRFQVKDYKDGGKMEEMTLEADEFIRRFLLHVLPKRFRKIRYGGFLAQAVREEKLQLARQSLDYETKQQFQTAITTALDEWTTDLAETCPNCDVGTLRTLEINTQMKPLLAINAP